MKYYKISEDRLRSLVQSEDEYGELMTLCSQEDYEEALENASGTLEEYIERFYIEEVK